MPYPTFGPRWLLALNPPPKTPKTMDTTCHFPPHPSINTPKCSKPPPLEPIYRISLIPLPLNSISLLLDQFSMAQFPPSPSSPQQCNDVTKTYPPHNQWLFMAELPWMNGMRPHKVPVNTTPRRQLWTAIGDKRPIVTIRVVTYDSTFPVIQIKLDPIRTPGFKLV